MPRGGARAGSGRPIGTNAIEAEKARALIVEKLREEYGPIVDKAIEQAKTGDYKAREWLSERGYGKVAQAVEVSGEITSKIISVDE